MTITNHMLVGALVALTIPEPVIALPLAFASHFVLDAIPHYGYPGNHGYGAAIKHKLAILVAIATLITSIWFGIWLGSLFPNLLLYCALAAALPDLFGITNWLAFERRGRQAPEPLYTFQVRFHRRIQRYERPWGIGVELIVGLLLLLLLLENTA